MRNTWLVLDAFFLGYRAFHSKSWMEFGTIKTGVTYGILQDVISLQDTFATNNVIFAFDVGKRKRNEIFPDYKAHRRADMTPEEEALYADFKQQMHQLRKSYLPRIGFRNVLFEHGYEADDVIASVCHNLPPEDEAIIVSADSDLFQLLAPNVLMHNPNSFKTTTLQSFKRDWGLLPKQWSKVKAISGCKGDNVPGIPGVREKTAAKYLRGELKPNSAAMKAIQEGWDEIVLRNKALVKLPFVGTPVFELVVDSNISAKGWELVAEELGLASLRHRLPLAGRQARRPRLLPHG